jgi:hypothetical protein
VQIPRPSAQNSVKPITLPQKRKNKGVVSSKKQEREHHSLYKTLVQAIGALDPIPFDLNANSNSLDLKILYYYIESHVVMKVSFCKRIFHSRATRGIIHVYSAKSGVEVERR